MSAVKVKFGSALDVNLGGVVVNFVMGSLQVKLGAPLYAGLLRLASVPLKAPKTTSE